MPQEPGSNQQLSEEQSSRLSTLYEEAETEILKEISRALLRGNKTEYLEAMLSNVRAILKDLRAGSRTWCEEAIPLVYIAGAEAADAQMKKAGVQMTASAGFGGIHQQAAQVLAEAAYNRLEDVVSFIGRRTEDIYRTLALENVRGSVAGYKTWQKVAETYREQLAEQGITGFRDKANREWNMRSYADMVSRTTTMEAHLEGTKNRIVETGHDLVKVSTHAGACEKCQPWEGKILSLTGKTEGYPTLQEAKEAGLFHPNCGHAYGLYLAGVDEEDK
jgi:hypothetical protein